MNALVLTLGHNSSAILIKDGEIVVGYEEERLSGLKSDSAFPHRAIERIKKVTNCEFDAIYIGHWFTGGSLVESKYYDYSEVLQLVNGDESRIKSLTVDCTHHDSHMYAAKVFAEAYSFPDSYTCIVADGFGTAGESLSVYDVIDNEPKLLKRVFNFNNSLGMLYQYTTLYLGMKMHADEYKLLGYEAHIRDTLSSKQFTMLSNCIDDEVTRRCNNIWVSILDDTDPIVNTLAMSNCRESIFKLLDNVSRSVLNTTQQVVDDKYVWRIVIAYFTQSVVERVIKYVWESIGSPTKLLVSGGLFYNVKLNWMLSNLVDHFCVFPLAGDQGAGLGVYEYYEGNLIWPGHVYWGIRPELSKNVVSTKGIQIFHIATPRSVYTRISQELRGKGFANIVKGNMEFGPRSLGNTATIAIPTIRNVERINYLNERTTVMPMAPIMTQEQYDKYIVKPKAKIYGSLKYMITACSVNHKFATSYPGACHKYSDGNVTCRPQIIDRQSQPILYDLCVEFGPLINTSFNFHGVPIVFDSDDIIKSHAAQFRRADVLTIVIPGA